jgi:hypothetical protein
VDKKYFIGYKLYLLTSEQGVFPDIQTTPGNVHQVNSLKETRFEESTKGKTLLGYHGYDSRVVQTVFITNHQIRL